MKLLKDSLTFLRMKSQGMIRTTSTGTGVPNMSEEQLLQEEQKALLKPYEKPFILKVLAAVSTKLWQAAHYPIKNMSWMFFASVLLCAIGVTVGAMSFRTRGNDSSLSSEKYSTVSRISELKRTYDYFYKVASPIEKRVRWETMFSGWRYKLNGDPKYKEADCVGAVYLYYQKWGANFQLESVPWLIARVKNLSERNLVRIRKSTNEVVSGDLIILKISEENQHVGVVLDTPNGYVRYMDVNVGTMTEGLEKIKWGDPAIVYVAEMSFQLWIGDLMQELNKQ
jgi:hypothetical protein